MFHETGEKLITLICLEVSRVYQSVNHSGWLPQVKENWNRKNTSVLRQKATHSPSFIMKSWSNISTMSIQTFSQGHYLVSYGFFFFPSVIISQFFMFPLQLTCNNTICFHPDASSCNTSLSRLLLFSHLCHVSNILPPWKHQHQFMSLWSSYTRFQFLHLVPVPTQLICHYQYATGRLVSPATATEFKEFGQELNLPNLSFSEDVTFKHFSSTLSPTFKKLEDLNAFLHLR